MGGGIDNPVAGYAAFCVVKFAGYTLAALPIRAIYASVRPNPFVAGAVRTVIGMAAGALYYLVLTRLNVGNWRGDVPLVYLGLIPVRIAEWWLLVWMFYDRKLDNPNRGWLVAGAGTVWSYILDIPAVFGFITVGGFWVC
jgi:hypothetical protein